MLDNVATFRWTEANVDTLRTLYESGMSAGKIADELGHGCTRNAVIGKKHRLGLVRDVVNVAGRPRKDGVARKPVAAKPRPRPPAVVEPAWQPPAPAVVRSLQPTICAPVPNGGLLMHELEQQHCRWPMLEVDPGHGDEMRYCGETRVERGPDDVLCPYCDKHAAIAYGPPRARTERQREGDERRRVALLRRRAAA